MRGTDAPGAAAGRLVALQPPWLGVLALPTGDQAFFEGDQLQTIGDALDRQVYPTLERVMAETPDRPPRERIDLRHRLPWPARYALAVVVIALLALAGWAVGRDDPVPGWIGEILVPLLGWAWLVLAAIALWLHWRRRRDAARSASERVS